MVDRGNSAVARIVYRALLRWSRDHADVPLSLRLSEVSSLVPQLPIGIISLNDSAAVKTIARWCFQDSRDLQGHAARAAVDRGLDALRVLNSHYAAQAADMKAIRAERLNREGIAFQVGQVFVHRKFGYRAVVYGWDRKCERDPDWVAAMGVDGNLPFYYALPDERDCERLFGGVRLSKYVCQDNMMPVEGVTVLHRALENYFIGYSPSLLRYIPVRRLAYEYPGKYTADKYEVLRPLDSNLLRHPEVQRPGNGTEDVHSGIVSL